MDQPKTGDVIDGYYFKGGNASQKDNWVEAPKLGQVHGEYIYTGGDPSKQESWDNKKNYSGNAIDALVSKGVNSALLGYAPQLYAGTNQAIESARGFLTGTPSKDIYEQSKNRYQTLQNTLQQEHPIASMAGTLSGYALPGMAAGKLVGAGKAALGLELAPESGFIKQAISGIGTGATEGGLIGAANNPEQGSRVDNALLGAGVGAGAGLIGAGGRGLMGMIGKNVDALSVPYKPNAEDLMMSGERIGVQPTKGMLTGDRYTQDIESSLAQSPTFAGRSVAKQQQSIYQGMKDAGNQVFGEPGALSDVTSYQAGGQAKNITKKGIEKSLEPAVGIYNKIEKEVPFIDINPASTTRISNNILNLPYAKIDGSQSSSLAKQVTSTLGKSKTLDEVRNLRSYVGKILSDRNAEPALKDTAGEIYGRLSQMEQNAITRSAIKAAKNPEHGKAIAGEMIKEIKDANQVYANVSKKLQDMAQNMGMGKVRNYSEFIRKMEAIPDERFMDKVFNPTNVKAVQQFSQEFPEAFEALKKSKLADLYVKSSTKGEISLPKLVGLAKKLSPEYKKLLFGEEASQSLKDIETVYNSTYQPVGQSGTPKGQKFFAFNPINPMNWFNELSDASKKMALQQTPQTLQMIKKTADIAAPIGRGLLRSIPGSATSPKLDKNQ